MSGILGLEIMSTELIIVPIAIIILPRTMSGTLTAWAGQGTDLAKFYVGSVPSGLTEMVMSSRGDGSLEKGVTPRGKKQK